MASINHSDESQETAVGAKSPGNSFATGQKVVDWLSPDSARVTYTHDPSAVTAVQKRAGIPDPRVQETVYYRIDGSRRVPLQARGEAEVCTSMQQPPLTGARAE
jgi:hypothetical protein